jgi:hypothetical protein
MWILAGAVDHLTAPAFYARRLNRERIFSDFLTKVGKETIRRLMETLGIFEIVMVSIR